MRRTQAHTFVPIMGFASDDMRPVLHDTDTSAWGEYPTPEEALNAVIDEYSEYGAYIDPECHLSNDEFEKITSRRKQLERDVLGVLRRREDDSEPAEETAGRVVVIAAQLLDMRFGPGEQSRAALTDEILYAMRRDRDETVPVEATAAYVAAFAEEWLLALASDGDDSAHS